MIQTFRNEAIGNIPIEYDTDLTMPPDEVTVNMGMWAVGLVSRRRAALAYAGVEAEPTSRLLDVGCGVGTYLVSAAATAPENMDLELAGFDVDPHCVEFCTRNLGVVAGDGSRHIAQTMLASWDDYDFLTSENLGTFDGIYFNPPYLFPGTLLLDEYAHAPHEHLFVDDPLGVYRAAIPRLLPLLRVGGSMLARASSHSPNAFADFLPGSMVSVENALAEGIECNSLMKFFLGKLGIYHIFTRMVPVAGEASIDPSNDPRVELSLKGFGPPDIRRLIKMGTLHGPDPKG